MKLRPYQNELISDLRARLRKNKRVVLCAPTGSGKTVMFTHIVTQMVTKNLFTRCLVITDRIELLKQTFKAINSAGVEPYLYNAKTSKHQTVTNRVVIAMVETIKRRAKLDKLRLGDFDMIIIDEAHKGNFKAIFEIWPDAFYVGATATPLATSKVDPLKNYYQDIAFKFDVPDLIEMGFLVGVHPYKMTVIDNANLVKSHSTGDYTEKSQHEEFSKPTVFAGLLSAWKKHASDKKTIVFCVNIQHTIDTARDFLAAGYSAVYITSKSTTEERAEALSDFHSGRAQIMVNCGILTTGYDHPPIECVVMNRATMSLPLWLQCCGRGSRIYPGKEEYILIDMGGNIDRNGQWDDERDWRDWFFNPPKPGQSQPAPVKECPNCESIIPARMMECKFCGYVYPPSEDGAELADGELVEVRKAPEHLKGRKLDSLTTLELFELYKSMRYKKGLILRVLRSRGESELHRFARIAKFKSGWVYFQSKQDTIYTNITIR